MNINSICSIRSRAAWLKAVGVFAFASMLPHDQADAFAPQDSTHVTRTIPRLPGETQWHAAMVANDRIWYSVSHYQGPIRARNFDGELVFEHVDSQARIASSSYYDYTKSQYAISKDGRLYYFIEPPQQQYNRRVCIINPDGSKFGEFGPSGQNQGVFGSGHGRHTFPDIAVSPTTGRLFISDEATGSSLDSSKKGLIRVFDRDGKFLYEFRTTGVLASTLEGMISHIMVRTDSQGNDEVIVVESQSDEAKPANFKVFGAAGDFRRLVTGGIFSNGWNSRTADSNC